MTVVRSQREKMLSSVGSSGKANAHQANCKGKVKLSVQSTEGKAHHAGLHVQRSERYNSMASEIHTNKSWMRPES